MRSSSSCTASCSAARPVAWGLSLSLLAALSWALGLPGCGAAKTSAPAEAAQDQGLGDDGFGGPPEINWQDANIEEGARLFTALCAGCHGVKGDGKSRAASHIAPPPRDLTRGEYRFRSTTTGRLPTRTDMLRTLELGLPGTAMPAWKGKLSPRRLRSMVRYLETLSPRFAEEARGDDDVTADTAVLLPAAITEGTLAQGREVYKRMKCGQCHGEDGRGDGKAATTHRNADGTPSHVFDFTFGVYKGGTRAVDVYRTFMTGLDGTPMPSYAPSLPQQSDRWALVHYVRSLSRERGLWFWISERATWRDPMLGQGEPDAAAQ